MVDQHELQEGKVTIRQREASPNDHYEQLLRRIEKIREQQYEKKVVIKGEETDWEQNRQGRVKYLLDPLIKDTALEDWWVFVQDIQIHSGKHRHQGGLVIYALEGKGYTVYDGVKYDWEEGDLLLIPIKPGGVEHQHFNAYPGQPAKWVAFIYDPFWMAVASELTQTSNSPYVK